MRLRKQDASGDYQFGRGQADFYHDDPRGVGQLVQTRLALQLGDWFLDITDGTPYRTQVLGFRTDATRDPALRARILATPGVKSLSAYGSQLSRSTRDYAVQATVETIFGRTIVSTAVAGPNQDVTIAR